MSQQMLHDDERSGAIDLRLWWNFIKHLKPHKRVAWTMCGAGFGLAIVETSIPPLTGWMIDEALESGVSDRLLWMGGVFATRSLQLHYEMVV